mgnify:CR=1 FL=1
MHFDLSPRGREWLSRVESFMAERVVPSIPTWEHQARGTPALPLDTACGEHMPPLVALIDESRCIGCTLCIQACPVDAIVGAQKVMHTVIADYCTGCELCLPPCPVDCIEMRPVSGTFTGWQAWSEAQAREAQARYEWHVERTTREQVENQERLAAKARHKLAHLEDASNISDPKALERKRAVVEAEQAVDLGLVQNPRRLGRHAGFPGLRLRAPGGGEILVGLGLAHGIALSLPLPLIG